MLSRIKFTDLWLQRYNHCNLIAYKLHFTKSVKLLKRSNKIQREKIIKILMYENKIFYYKYLCKYIKYEIHTALVIHDFYSKRIIYHSSRYLSTY